MGSEEMNSRILSIQPDNSSESAIAKLIEHTIELLPDEFEALIDAQIKRMGIEATIIQVVFPFFERISLLWATSHICPAHEHMVSNIIRQKLVVGIEKVTASVKKEYTVLLFLPEYEFHELGLLYTHFLMKSWGIHILYLGANVPVSDVVFVAKEKKPDLLMMHLTSLPGQYNIDKYFSTLAKSVQPVPILVSGLFVKTYKKPLPKNINFKYSLHEVLEFIKGV